MASRQQQGSPPAAHAAPFFFFFQRGQRGGGSAPRAGLLGAAGSSAVCQLAKFSRNKAKDRLKIGTAALP